MPHAQRSVVIDRPAAEVFDFFTDHGNDSRWRPVVKQIDADRPGQVGATVHQLVKGPGGCDGGERLVEDAGHLVRRQRGRRLRVIVLVRCGHGVLLPAGRT